MTSIIKKLMLIVYIMISFIVLFNMYNNKYYSFNNKMIFENAIIRSHNKIYAKTWEGKKYYEDIKTNNDEYKFSFYRDYLSDEEHQGMLSKHDYYGIVMLEQNSTGHKKAIVDTYNKLDSYVEFVAKNKIRINGDIYLDLVNDGYIHQDEDRNIGGRFIYFVVVPFLVFFVFNLPCIGISILIDFGLIIEMISSLYF